LTKVSAAIDKLINKMIPVHCNGCCAFLSAATRPSARQDRAARDAASARDALFARRGIRAARHAEIARRARVSVPTVFFYFPTRKALVNAVLEEVARFFAEMADAAHAKRGQAPEVILEHLRAFAEAVDTHPDHMRVLLEWSTALRDEVWPLFLRFQEKIIATLARTIRRWRMETESSRDLEAEDDARVIAATGNVLVQMKVGKLPDSRIERFLQTMIQDTLGEVGTDATTTAHISRFNVAVG
jgi:TetR/AcrR family transcriptional regulator, hemagglutinin/protease regulatory protein